MTPIFFTVDNSLLMTVIPKISYHLYEHPILTYTYHIFLNSSKHDPSRILNDEITVKEKLKDPDYYGYITFEDTQSLFSYTQEEEGQRELTRDELEEIIDLLKHYRENTALWHFNN
jgi:hypothetical protein